MVHVDAVRDLMRHHPAAHFWRGQHEAPVVADRAAFRAASPARHGIADADRADRDPGAARGLGGVGRQQVAGTSPQPRLDPPGEAVERSAAGQYVALEVDGSRAVGVPDRAAPPCPRAGSLRPARTVRWGAAWRARPRPTAAGPPPSRAPPCGWRAAGRSAAAGDCRGRASAAAGGRGDGRGWRPARAGRDDRARPQSGRSTRCHSSSPASSSLTVQPRVDWPASWTVSRLPEIR